MAFDRDVRVGSSGMYGPPMPVPLPIPQPNPLNLPIPGTFDPANNYRPDWRRGNILPIEKDMNSGRFRPAVPGIFGSLFSAATLPGDVYAGRVDPMSEDGMRRASELASMVTLGAGAIPGPPNALRAGANRNNFGWVLMRAAPNIKNTDRMNLTPERMNRAKSVWQDLLDADPILRDQGRNYNRTPHGVEAQQFAREVIKSGVRPRLRFPDGSGGSAYVSVPGRGTVRFSDHHQPQDYLGNIVGGYSKELGRRHYPSEMSVTNIDGVTYPESSYQDALDWLYRDTRNK